MYCTFGKPTVHHKLFRQAPPLVETIYNLVPKVEVPQEKSPRYKSVYSSSVKEFYESQKVPHKTMGVYKTELPCPKKYLKKQSHEPRKQEGPKRQKDPKQNEVGECGHPGNDAKVLSVPKHDERPVMVSNANKNFIKENIRNVTRVIPKKPVPKWVDSKKGDSILLEFSGLVPKYCTKKEYGVTPKYLVMRQEDMDYARQKYEEYVREEMEKEAPKKISNEERKELIAGLKKNWAESTREYATLPLFTDTIRKKARKEQIEERLRTLEKDIELLERHAEIYVLP